MRNYSKKFLSVFILAMLFMPLELNAEEPIHYKFATSKSNSNNRYRNHSPNFGIYNDEMLLNIIESQKVPTVNDFFLESSEGIMEVIDYYDIQYPSIYEQRKTLRFDRVGRLICIMQHPEICIPLYGKKYVYDYDEEGCIKTLTAYISTNFYDSTITKQLTYSFIWENGKISSISETFSIFNDSYVCDEEIAAILDMSMPSKSNITNRSTLNLVYVDDGILKDAFSPEDPKIRLKIDSDGKIHKVSSYDYILDKGWVFSDRPRQNSGNDIFEDFRSIDADRPEFKTIKRKPIKYRFDARGNRIHALIKDGDREHLWKREIKYFKPAP